MFLSLRYPKQHISVSFDQAYALNNQGEGLTWYYKVLLLQTTGKHSNHRIDQHNDSVEQSIKQDFELNP